MKNITKQNFKTNPLWIRLLIMTLMVLLGTSSVWGKSLYVYSSNSNSYAWIWNKSNTGSNFTGGTWPGAKLNNTSYFTALGNNWYKFKTNITVEYGLILSGGASNGQTSDIFINDDIYLIKHGGGSTYETYGAPSGYKIKNSWGNDVSFSSFSENKQAYTMSAIQLSAGTYTMQVYKGSSKYWSSFDNSRGSGVTLSGGGQNGFSFTLTSAMSVTFYYDPGADKVFAVGVSSTYTVKKSENVGGTVKLGDTVLTTSNQSINSGSYALSITAPTGYKVSTVSVDGGSLTTEGTTGSAEYTGTVNVTAATTVTVTYAKLTYSITYNANGGSGAPDAQTKTYNVALTLSSTVPTRTGYTFTGWNTASNGSGTAYASGASYTENAAATLYAQWEADTYAITYNANGGSGAPNAQTKTYDVALTLSSTVPTRTGYTFQNWNTKADGSGTSYAKGGTYTTNAAATLYAQWKITTYTITYNANNGSGAPAAQTKTYNVALTLSSTKPTRTGYTFQNWNTASDGSGTTYKSGATYTANAAATLYAQWTANQYAITYKDQGNVAFSGTHASGYPTTHTYGTATPLKTATKDDYNFLGWFTSSDCSGTAVTTLGATAYTANITLYAKWEEICYQSATEGTGSYSNGEITLSAKFNTCGSAYIGFQWKEEGKDWCYDNSDDCYVQLGSQTKQNVIVTATVAKASGKSYMFRPYIVVGNDAKNWLYGTEFTVGTCTLPIINSTDADFNQNNFADFAALYVTDCSGKEVTAYQWYKDGNEYASKCEYTTKDGVVTGDAGDAGKTNNIRPNAAGNYTCKVTYKGGTSATSAAFYVNATSGETKADFKSNLPVIMVNTGSKNFPSCPAANETASKNAEKMKKKLSVDVKILFDGNIVYDRKARMAYRGSSSLNFQKKSYAFCPGDANCGDADKGPDYVKTAKLNMLGIGEAADKDWVLYAAAADPSMLRNRMVFETYQAMRPGEWGVKSRYVELIINGEYKGVYLMMDKITQNKKRVNVEWDVKDETKRGFILKFDKTDIPDRSVDYPDGDEKTFLSKYSGKYDITTYDAQVDQAFEIEYPEKEDIQDDGGNWYEVVDFIKGMINEFETALSAGDYAKVQQYIDYESWADWFILSEYTKNVDAFRASCVFTYDGTKIKATPLWDQELSFNNQSVHANRTPSDGGNKGCQDATGLLIKHNNVYTDGFAAPFWFTGQLAGGKGTEKLAAKTFTGALLNDQCFVQMVKNRWEAHKSGALSKASLTALITEYEKELTSDVRTREANFWNGKSRNTLSCDWPGHNTGYYDDDYADAKADITNWISDNNATNTGTGRRKGLDTAISALEGTGFDISIAPASIETTPWVPVVIQVQNETGYEYTLTYTDGSLDQVKDLIIEKSGDTYKYHIPRPWPAGDEKVEGERTDINYGIKATLQVGEGNNQCGSSTELPSATATIVLKDEINDGCK